MNSQSKTSEGGCGCGHIRYQLLGKPLIVHACHCTFCQCQTGSAFAQNALFETTHVTLLKGEVEETLTPSPSGKGQTIARCPECHVAVWSNYYMGGIKEKIRFIRVGTLDNSNLFKPDVHIFTTTKLNWLVLPPSALAVEEFYVWEDVWTIENMNKLKALRNEVNSVPV